MFSFSIFILAWISSDSDCCWDEEKKYHWQFAAFYLCTLICAPIHTRRFKTVRLVVLHFIYVFHDIECASDIYRLISFYQQKKNLFKLDLFDFFSETLKLSMSLTFLFRHCRNTFNIAWVCWFYTTRDIYWRDHEVSHSQGFWKTFMCMNYWNSFDVKYEW